ncbi:hypothetical protein KTI59_15785 [Acinetobacter radioresistens]|uniref:hypothetical protein n=1 Tax=Acinetobacter radioresistens TaxID=40216 RepID=UPI0021CD90A3|nr:hypothetical protein [Acinetobacter radioresistens]MCU4501518.1 hypothetical protein [Acinetobacter radioresistens]
MKLIRASAIGKIMAYPERDTLADGAMTFLEELASQVALDWEKDLDLRMIEKGRIVEDEAIQLYNDVNFTNYVKNTERKSTDLITGECDIDDPENSLIIDIKSSWSKATHPYVLHLGGKKGYEWQLRAYMHLWNRNKAQLAYCLVDTPYELLGYEDEKLHEVSHIDMALRVTMLDLERDAIKEKQMLAKAKTAKYVLAELLDKKGLKVA